MVAGRGVSSSNARGMVAGYGASSSNAPGHGCWVRRERVGAVCRQPRASSSTVIISFRERGFRLPPPLLILGASLPPIPPKRTLTLSAFDGSDISNSIESDPSPERVKNDKGEMNSYLRVDGVKEIAPPSGRYNCFGFVLGGRRTNIPAVGELDFRIDRLLSRDGYAQVDEPAVSDVVAYRREGSGGRH